MMSWPDFNYKQIIVHISGGSGERIRYRADNIIIEDAAGKVILQHSCHKLFALFIIGDTTITSVAIRKSISFAFPIILMNANMKFVTAINCAAEGNTVLRNKQYSNSRELEIARCIIKQKIDNQINLLEMLRYKSEEDSNAIHVLKNIQTDSVKNTQELLGMEGFASRTFFPAYFRTLKWTRREPRCKHDINNLLLDIGYIYVFNFIDSMLGLYGFDKYCGVYHTCFYQRKSLVCDLVEPFRCIIDRRLRKAHMLRQINEDDFFFKDNQFHLAYDKQAKYTSLFLKDILEQKEHIFHFCQQYYRWFMQNKPITDFPVFSIAN